MKSFTHFLEKQFRDCFLAGEYPDGERKAVAHFLDANRTPHLLVATQFLPPFAGSDSEPYLLVDSEGRQARLISLEECGCLGVQDHSWFRAIASKSLPPPSLMEEIIDRELERDVSFEAVADEMEQIGYEQLYQAFDPLRRKNAVAVLGGWPVALVSGEIDTWAEGQQLVLWFGSEPAISVATDAKHRFRVCCILT